MTILQSIILGIIQGLTEFLPVSSSAHLVLVPFLVGWKFPESEVFIFDVLVQLGTLLAVIIYFWRDLWNIIREFVLALVRRKPFGTAEARMGWYLILATIPAGLAGVLIKDKVEAAFNSPTATAAFLFLTAAFLITAELLGKRTRKLEHFNWLDALVMGLFQAVSIFPGVSRSGSTITGGMLRSLDRPSAARFSFLMSVPVMLAAGLLASLDLAKSGISSTFLPQILLGMLAAAVVGYISIRWLLGYISHHSLYVFAIYCMVLGAVVLFFALSKPQVREIPAPGEAFSVALSPDAAYLEPGLRECASGATQDALFINSSVQPEEEGADLAIRLGAPAKLPPFTVQLADQPLVIIVNPQNTVKSMSLEDLRFLYTGESTGEAAVWSYPEDHPARGVFDIALLEGKQLTSEAYLAPGPQEMVEAVAKDPRAIGYVPGAWVDDSVRVVDMELPAEMHLPVLALAQEEPQGALRGWLSCLQNSSSNVYLPVVAP